MDHLLFRWQRARGRAALQGPADVAAAAGPPAAAPVSNRPKKITLEHSEPAAPAAISMGDKEFETAVQTYTGALQGYAEAARAKPKKTRFGGRARSSDAKARG